MKKSKILACLLFVSPHVWATPEAYPGLAADAYHPLLTQQLKNKSNKLTLPLFNAEFTIPQGLEKNKSTNGDISFEQHNEFGHINVTVGNNSIFGDWHHKGKDYRFTTDKSGSWLIELPSNHLIQDACGTEHHSHETLKDLPIANKQAAGTVIDILVVHNRALALRYPGNLMQTRINHYMHVANQTFANSGLDLAARLVGIEELPYNHNNSNNDMLSHMRSTISNQAVFTGLQDLPEMRENTGADLIIAIRPHDIQTRGNCGLAYYPTPGFDASYGMNMVSDGMSSWSLCSDQVFVHEIGHNLGAAHQYGAGGGTFQAQGSAFIKMFQFNTVMGSFGTGQNNRSKRMPMFSNPSLMCGGYACGVSSGSEPSNNTAVINSTMNSVANYMPNSSSAPQPADYQRSERDFDHDGVNDWHDHFPFDASESADADLDGTGDNSDAFPNDPAEQTDSDQDGVGNNSDNDDDGDGRSDANDAFPLNASEQNDSDSDGVGDGGDAFPNNPAEQHDFDNDGTGDHADRDDDNDGTEDLLDGVIVYRQDLLVINEGDNRILRFDAQTGRSLGIEVLPEDGLLTFQSDMSYDAENQLLYYTSASGVKVKNLMQRDGSDMLIPAYPQSAVAQTSLGTGFPTALFKPSGMPLLVSKIDRGTLSLFETQNPRAISEQGDWFVTSSSREESFIDIEYDSNFYLLGLEGRIYRGINGSFNQLSPLNFREAVDMTILPNGHLLVSDYQKKQLIEVNENSGEMLGIFANMTVLGLGKPSGMNVTQDNVLLVATKDDNKIHRFDAINGDYLGVLVDGLGLNKPHKTLLVPSLQDRFHNDAGKVIRPNAGQWFAQSSAGRGFDIEVVGNRLNVIWYTFDSNGQPTWYISAGDLDGFNYYSSLGKTQQLDIDTVTLDDIGTLDITFLNERQAEITWSVGLLSGTELIEWHPFNGEPEINNYTGLWGRPDGPGWGISLATVGETSVSIAFIYDEMGEPRWVISTPFEGQSPLQFDYLYVTSDTLCPSCSGVSDFEAAPAGSMLMSFGNNPYWDSDITFPQPINGVWQMDGVPLTRFSSEPTRPR
ncbi:zinc-dependent metalloprotease family protein [Marinicella rhabdoformis]|uniref:zinc-dependent metalloprotease family protein n=1 Tax=Marinicella rhabdoformis TaxID=2580566 RepID=UPI0012AEB591|nr:zinc-dependent metalloprotease family protein [Marinicella rhabdoformis]